MLPSSTPRPLPLPLPLCPSLAGQTAISTLQRSGLAHETTPALVLVLLATPLLINAVGSGPHPIQVLLQ